MGVRADLERLRDVPRVMVGELTMTGPDAARLVLVAVDPENADEADGAAPATENGHDPAVCL